MTNNDDMDNDNTNNDNQTYHEPLTMRTHHDKIAINR